MAVMWLLTLLGFKFTRNCYLVVVHSHDETVDPNNNQFIVMCSMDDDHRPHDSAARFAFTNYLPSLKVP